MLVVATGFSKHPLGRGLALPVITAISSKTGFDDLARDRIGLVGPTPCSSNKMAAVAQHFDRGIRLERCLR